MKAKLTFLSLILLSSVVVLSQDYRDCDKAFPVCGGSDLAFDVSDDGNFDNITIPTGCTLEQNATIWVRFKAATTGTITFVISPVNPVEDYDFAVFGPNPVCELLAPSIRSSFSGGTGNTGLSDTVTDDCEGAGGDRFVRPIDAVAGEEFVILVDNWSASQGPVSGFNLSWGGTADLDCSIVCDVELGDDIEVCADDTDEVTLDATSTTPGAQYEWSDGSTGPTLTVFETGTYSVDVIINEGQVDECISSDIIDVTFVVPLAQDAELLGCDDGTGQSTFTLSDADSDITIGDASLTVHYYPTMADAEAETNALPNTYLSSTVQIFARIEEASMNCSDIKVLDLTVIGSPIANNANDEVCADNESEPSLGNFTLSNYDNEVSGGVAGVVVSYHISQADADSGLNPLPNSYRTASITLFARVSQGADCFATSLLVLDVLDTPFTAAIPLSACDEGGGTANFDIEELRADYMDGNTNYTVSIYSLTDATAQLNPLSGIVPSSGETLAVFIEDQNSGCSHRVNSVLTVNNLPNVSTYNEEFTSCTNELTGLATFALEDTRNDPTGFASGYYNSRSDAENGFQPITSSQVTGSADFIIYRRVQDLTTNCFSIAEINYVVENLIINEDAENIVCYGQTITLEDGSVITESGIYDILGDDGCTINRYPVRFTVCEPDEYCYPRMPTAFAPNGNGRNDGFGILDPLGCLIDISSFQIFNRWGEKVFDHTIDGPLWDGRFNGTSAHAGVYLWQIEFEYTDDQGNSNTNFVTGSVTLLR